MDLLWSLPCWRQPSMHRDPRLCMWNPKRWIDVLSPQPNNFPEKNLLGPSSRDGADKPGCLLPLLIQFRTPTPFPTSAKAHLLTSLPMWIYACFICRLASGVTLGSRKKQVCSSHHVLALLPRIFSSWKRIQVRSLRGSQSNVLIC